MTRTPVSSTAIKAVGFEAGVIECEMHNGTIYSYPDSTQEQFDALVGAPSIGKHFAATLRGRPFTKVVPEKAEA